MKFRQHRGGLAESMETVVELNTKEEFGTYMRNLVKDLLDLDECTLTVTEYTYDARIGWNTFLISVEGHGPIGMTDSIPKWLMPRVEFVYGPKEENV